MQILGRLLTALALILAIPTISFALEPAVRIQRDVEYSYADGQSLYLDIATPTTQGPHPLVVCIHGGAWKFGNKRDFSGGKPLFNQDFGTGKQCLIEFLAERGFTAATISYRLAPKSKFPAQLEDAKTAVRFLRANATQFAIDPERVAAVGFSAGAHIASLLGTVGPEADLEGPLYRDQSSRVKCVVDFFGPADLELYSESEGIERAWMVPLLGSRCRTKPDIYRRASPIDHVSPDDASFLIFHGTADFIVPVIHSERFVKKLVDTGVKAELLTMSGKGHGWGGQEAIETTRMAVQFLQDNLKSK